MHQRAKLQKLSQRDIWDKDRETACGVATAKLQVVLCVVIGAARRAGPRKQHAREDAKDDRKASHVPDDSFGS